MVYGFFFYCELEMVKIEVFKLNRGNYDLIMIFFDDMKLEL